MVSVLAMRIQPLIRCVLGCLLMLLAIARSPETIYGQAGADLNLGKIYQVEWSPDGQKVAIVNSGADGITILSRNFEVLGSFSEGIGSVAWSPDSQYITVGYGYGFFIYDTSTFEQVSFVEFGLTSSPPIAWNPQSNIIAVVLGGIVQIFDVTTGERIKYVVIHEISHAQITSMQWHEDGIHLLTGGVEDTVNILNTQTDVITTFPQKGNVNIVKWSPDFKQFAVVIQNSVYIWDIATQEIIQTLTGSSYYIATLDWRDYGIITASYNDNIRIWDTVTWEVKQVFIPEMRISGASWIPQSKEFFYWGGSHNDRLSIETSHFGPTVEHLRAKVAECVIDTHLSVSLINNIDVERWLTFVREVEAQRDKKITSQCADLLIEIAYFLLGEPQ
jgi:WD40 repeat protein